MEVIIILTAFFLAYTNGANDNFKGVSTLFGSGATSYNVAINWGTLTTLTGSVFAIYLAHGLLHVQPALFCILFSGNCAYS